MTTSVREGLKDRVPDAGPITVRTIADELHLGAPLSLRDLIDLLKPINLKFLLNAPTAQGTCEIDLLSTGFVRFQGKVHESGSFLERYMVIASIQNAIKLPSPTGNVPEHDALLFQHGGTIAGALAFGSRDDSWDESTISTTIADNWTTVKNNSGSARTTFGTSVGAFEVFEALAAGATGAFVVKL